MKSLIKLLIIISIALIPSCTLTPSQQKVAIATANFAITKLDKNKKISETDRNIIIAGVKAAIDPDSRTKLALIQDASLILNRLVEDGTVKQEDADAIDLALSLGSALIK